RIPEWLLPVVRENLASGQAPVTLSAAIFASWARYAEGVDEHGQPIDINDRMAERLKENAAGNREDILAFLRDRDVFGDLVDNAELTEAYDADLRSLHEVRSEATLDALLAAHNSPLLTRKVDQDNMLGRLFCVFLRCTCGLIRAQGYRHHDENDADDLCGCQPLPQRNSTNDGRNDRQNSLQQRK